MNQAGLRKYLQSGLATWHASVVDGAVEVCVADSSLFGTYSQDEHGIYISTSKNTIPGEIEPTFKRASESRASQSFCLKDFYERWASTKLRDRVFVYVTRSQENSPHELQLLGCDGFREEQAQPQGRRVPSAYLSENHHPAEGAWLLLKAVTGYEDFLTFRKLKSLCLFDPQTQEFQLGHYFQTSSESALPESWTHKRQYQREKSRVVENVNEDLGEPAENTTYTFDWMDGEMAMQSFNDSAMWGAIDRLFPTVKRSRP